MGEWAIGFAIIAFVMGEFVVRGYAQHPFDPHHLKK
jgi:hypothetical protein